MNPSKSIDLLLLHFQLSLPWCWCVLVVWVMFVLLFWVGVLASVDIARSTTPWRAQASLGGPPCDKNSCNLVLAEARINGLHLLEQILRVTKAKITWVDLIRITFVQFRSESSFGLEKKGKNFSHNSWKRKNCGKNKSPSQNLWEMPACRGFVIVLPLFEESFRSLNFKRIKRGTPCAFKKNLSFWNFLWRPFLLFFQTCSARRSPVMILKTIAFNSQQHLPSFI